MLLKFGRLSVRSLISYEMGVFMYKTLNGLAPDSILEMFEKQADWSINIPPDLPM